MDIYKEPENVDADIVANLGPLSRLAGVWEGDQGLDVAPERGGAEETPYRERLVLEPMGPVLNGPQLLYGLRYATTAWPIGAADPFHEEVGYWLWDPGAKMVMRAFIVPRGVSLLAGGKAEPDATEFEMSAEVGAETFGVSSNPFLDETFKTVRFVVKVTIHEDGSFSYDEDTVLKIRDAGELFHHTDKNTLVRVS